jgi:hypothetical protein
MSLRKDTLNALIRGAVICEINEPDMHALLMEEGGLEEISGILEAFGCRIAASRSGRALFLAWEDGGEEARGAIRSGARDLYEEWTRVRLFMGFMLEVDDTQGPLQMGVEVRASRIVSAIDTSAALRDSLSALAAAFRVNAATDTAKVSDILRKMKDMGYLKPVSKAREDYLVTGRIDLHEDLEEHFITHVGPLQQAADVASRQGDLFL